LTLNGLALNGLMLQVGLTTHSISSLYRLLVLAIAAACFVLIKLEKQLCLRIMLGKASAPH
jgi:hypothetical protein